MIRVHSKWLVLLCVMASGCAGKPPGQTVASGSLWADARKAVLTIDRALAPDCRDRRIVNTESNAVEGDVVVDLRRDRVRGGEFAETWTVERCGKNVQYQMTFMPTADGKGTYFKVQSPKGEGVENPPE